MKKRILVAAFILAASSTFAQQTSSPQAPSQHEIVASCNVQVGQALTALGQSQQQIIVLQAQMADLQKQLAEKKDAESSAKDSPKD